ncbi:MAG: hypothetical protein WCG21_11870 [Eubacteriales bacterium]
MLDIEALTYAMIQDVSASVTWSPGWPQTFAGLTSAQGIGCFKSKQNSNAGNTSTRRETHSRIAIEIQTWAATPELRNTYDLAINAVFGPVLTRSGSGGHLEEKLTGEITAYRSILIYEGTVDTVTLNVIK